MTEDSQVFLIFSSYIIMNVFPGYNGNILVPEIQSYNHTGRITT